ncbi:MAG: GtrA family protein [Oscillospiraceae bacterium]|nr:GtrA family protein [Oscillospiraceae bacterium]
MKAIKALAEKILKKPLTRELISYGIFGAATTVVGFGSYVLFLHVIGFSLLLSNILSHFLAIIFAFITNKIWVFKALNFSTGNIAKEFFKFLSSRLAALVIDTVLLKILVDVLSYDPIISKLVTSVIVVIINYLTSKKIVFK